MALLHGMRDFCRNGVCGCVGDLGVKEYESWLLGPGLDLILFIVQLGATGPPRYTLVLQIYNYITNFQLMCFCYMLFVGKMMPVLLSIRCFNDGDWVYRSLVAE